MKKLIAFDLDGVLIDILYIEVGKISMNFSIDR